MNFDQGKKIYSNFSDANKAAESMRRIHNEPFTPYKSGGNWVVGGGSSKVLQKKEKVKSFDDLRKLLAEFKESEYDNVVEDYISEIENESKDKISTILGQDTSWIIKSIEIKLGCEIGMSSHNRNSYLILDLVNGNDEISLKMGGPFSRHIPLIKRQAEKLKNSPIIWHTWNSTTSNWESNKWFYRIELKN